MKESETMELSKLVIPPYYRGRESGLVISAAIAAQTHHDVAPLMKSMARDIVEAWRSARETGIDGEISPRPPCRTIDALWAPVGLSTSDKGVLSGMAQCARTGAWFGRNDWRATWLGRPVAWEAARDDWQERPELASEISAWVRLRQVMSHQSVRMSAPSAVILDWVRLISREWDQTEDGRIVRVGVRLRPEEVSLWRSIGMIVGRDGLMRITEWDPMPRSQWAEVIAQPVLATDKASKGSRGSRGARDSSVSHGGTAEPLCAGLVRRPDGAYEGPSRKEARCAACGGDVAVGDPIIWRPVGRNGYRPLTYHRACYESSRQPAHGMGGAVDAAQLSAIVAASVAATLSAMGIGAPATAAPVASTAPSEEPDGGSSNG